MTDVKGLPAEVIREMEQSPVLQNYYAAQRLQAEAAVLEALNEQKRIAVKQQEVEELRRKNDIEETRNSEISQVLAMVKQIYTLTTSIMDAYIEKHHEPLYAMLQVILTQLGLILQSQNYILPELMKRMDDPTLADTARQIIENLRRQAQPPERGSTVVHIGDAPNTFTAAQAKINTMHITGE